MMRWAFGLLLLLGSTAVWGLGNEVHDAVTLELQGRLTEARESYRTVLLSKDFGDKPSAEVQALRVFLLKKLGHLDVDQGRLDEAWDLQLQLRSVGSPEALAQASKLKGRLLQPHKSPGPDSFEVLPSPAALVASAVPRYSRLQLGAFSDWNHVRTQLDILVEKGWSPWCEDRKVGKERLVAVFVVSHDPGPDLSLLKKQGFTPTVSAIDLGR